MSGCDDFEVLVEMRLHGALDAEGGARLDAHLLSCGSCRDFEARVKRAEDAMHAIAANANERIDWDRLEREVGEKVRRYKRLPMLSAIALVPLTAFIIWAAAAPGQRALMGVLALALGLTIVVLNTRTSREYARDASQALGARPELLVFYRVKLDEAIRRLRWARLYLPACAVFPLLPVIFHRAGMPAREMVFWIAFAVYNAAWALHSHVHLVRLRRQRAALD